MRSPAQIALSVGVVALGVLVAGVTATLPSEAATPASVRTSSRPSWRPGSSCSGSGSATKPSRAAGARWASRPRFSRPAVYLGERGTPGPHGAHRPRLRHRRHRALCLCRAPSAAGASRAMSPSDSCCRSVSSFLRQAPERESARRLACAGPGRGGNLMEALSALMAGFAVALKPINLMWGFIGVTLGTFVGVLPGVGPALTVAMLLPLTVKLDPTGALIMFAGIYYGAMFGGSTTTILLNTRANRHRSPPRSRATAWRRPAAPGRRLRRARSARSSPAPSLRCCPLLAPIVVDLALKFGPAEYFALMVFAFITVAAVLGSSTVRGLTSLFLGLLLGLVGIDSQTGQARFLRRARAPRRRRRGGARGGSLRRRRGALRRRLPKPALRDDREDARLDPHVGLGLEALVARLAARRRDRLSFGTIRRRLEIPTFLPTRPRKLSKHRKSSARAIEGVAGPEAANNAAATGVLVPLLTLGIPTSATAAILLGAFQNYGMQPGPLLFQTQTALVWGLIASLYVGNIILLILNLPADRPLGEGAPDPEGPALRRDPGVRHARRLQPAHLGRSRDALRFRPARLRHAALGHPGRPGGHRPDPRPARRDAVPPRAVDQPGRPERVRHAADLGNVPRDHRRAAHRAVRRAPLGRLRRA